MIRTIHRGDLQPAAELLERISPGGALVAAEKLFEPGSAEPTALGASRGDKLVGLAVTAGRYLRILGVAPEHRGCGVGSALLEAVGDGELICAAEPGNYLTPGIASADADTIGWLERRGFERCGEAVNLIVDVAGNPAVSNARLEVAVARLEAAGYSIQSAEPDGELLELVAGDHGRSWAIEVERAARVFAVRDREGAIVGFAARDANNRGLGGFGPAATHSDHRGRGIGEALLLSCLLDVAASGHARCTVGWIGPRAFYQSVAAIAGEERFVVMRRPKK